MQNDAVALSGTSTELAEGFAGTVTAHTGTLAITNNDYTITQLETIAGASSGTITFTTTDRALSGNSTNLAAALANTSNYDGAVAITNADYTLDELVAINNGTGGAITFTTATTALTGTSAKFAQALAGTITYGGAVTIDNNDYTLDQLSLIHI